jgi:Uma2 family endonuclease
MSALEIQTRRWTRREYDRLVELGILDEDEPIELVDGEMVVREPRQTPHVTATALVADALRRAFGRGWWVRAQEPVALDDDSEPEPDVSVVRGTPRDYLAAHPSRPVLIVEIAESSLAFDRRRKAGLYARAGIADYWIVNLDDRVVEVYRRPARTASARYGWKYRSVRTRRPGASISPLAAPARRVAVADLLPWTTSGGTRAGASPTGRRRR